MPKIELQTGNLSDFFKSLLGLNDDDIAHDACNCSVCQIKRLQVPTAPEGEELVDALRDSLKGVVALTQRAQTSASRFCSDLISAPLSPAGEDIVLQFALDRILAAVRAQHALNALLPEERRAPADVLGDPAQYTLELMRETLAKARKLSQEKFDVRRAEEQAKRDAREAVEAAQPSPEAG